MYSYRLPGRDGEAGTGTYVFPWQFQYISRVREDPFMMSYGHQLVQDKQVEEDPETIAGAMGQS